MSSKIMIVDDELSMRTYVQMMLEPQGYELQLLESGLELIDELSKPNIPDLIILDVIMPMMTGFEACRKIKTNPRWQHIPVILVTVLETKEAILKGMDAGADDFIQKPINFNELQARVRSMLRIKNQYDELQKILHLREELSNMVVHDMSSPITLIQLHTALLEEQLTDPIQREHLEMIQVAAERLDSFTNDMLMMAKFEHSKLRVNPSEVEINDMILNSEKHFSIMAKSKGIELKLELPEQPLKLLIDQHLFSRVIANLLTNAIQYSPPQSKVILRLQYLNKHLKLQVLDEGVGIPEADQERIFNKFEVVELKKKGIKQIGLGLTFCKMVVDAHGGKIYVQANQPHGSIFTVEI